jgi:hypothetical protein
MKPKGCWPFSLSGMKEPEVGIAAAFGAWEDYLSNCFTSASQAMLLGKTNLSIARSLTDDIIL